MKSQWGIAAAVLASMGLGALTVEGLHAQSKPPVYFIGEIEVTDPEGYAKEYLPKAREIIKAHGRSIIGCRGSSGWKRKGNYRRGWRAAEARGHLQV